MEGIFEGVTEGQRAGCAQREDNPFPDVSKAKVWVVRRPGEAGGLGFWSTK